MSSFAAIWSLRFDRDQLLSSPPPPQGFFSSSPWFYFAFPVSLLCSLRFAFNSPLTTYGFPPQCSTLGIWCYWGNAGCFPFCPRGLSATTPGCFIYQFARDFVGLRLFPGLGSTSRTWQNSFPSQLCVFFRFDINFCFAVFFVPLPRSNPLFSFFCLNPKRSFLARFH